MTCSDVIAKVRSMLKDIPQATADIDWFDDDTSNSIEVYMSKAPSVTHARMLNIMIKNGYRLIDFDSNAEVDDTPVCFSTVYWFE